MVTIQLQFPGKMLSIPVLILSITVLGTVANELPAYIHTCRQNDPNLNECVKTNANLAMETLQYGDESLNLPKLDGIKFIDSITIKPLTELPFSLVIKNCRGYGIDDIRAKYVKVDLVRKHFELLYTSPQIIWQCEYVAQATGKFGIISQKSGEHNITYNNGEFLYQMDYKLNKINDERYIHITSHGVDFQTVEIIHHLEDIESDPVINGFWEQTIPHFVTDDVRQACSDLITRYLEAFFDGFPYNQIFTP